MRSRQVALSRVIFVLGAAACSVGTPMERENVGTSTAAITGGAADSTSAEANAILQVGCLESGCVAGTGVALTPLLYLTSNHMVTGSIGGTPPASDFSARFAPLGGGGGTAVVAWDKKRPPSTHKPTAIDPNLLDDSAQDVALVYLDPASLDALANKPALRVHMARPSFQIPASSQTGGVYTFSPATQFAGWALSSARYVATASTLTLVPRATGAYWSLTSASVHVDHGDSGGGLFATRSSDLTRDSFGLISSGTTTETDFSDLTNSAMVAWIRARAIDPTWNHTSKWNTSHPPPVGYTDRWYGEVDYTGACDTVNDPDCDGWYSTIAKGQHDNCPRTYNPSQRDTFDRGFGDACPCPCDPAGDSDYDNDGKCAVACPSQEADNCPKVANPLQENCNADAELAHNQSVLGDACDPVPCPASVADIVGTTVQCSGDAQIGGSCVGRNFRRRIDTKGIASPERVNAFETVVMSNLCSDRGHGLRAA